MAIPLPKGSIMKWNGTSVTEHNRSALSVDVQKIEKSNRMVNGTLRKVVIAEKRTWSCNWDNLPDQMSKTVDAMWSAREIELFYFTTPGAFTLTINDGINIINYTVMLTKFSKTISKRLTSMGLWQVSIEMEEV